MIAIWEHFLLSKMLHSTPVLEKKFGREARDMLEIQPECGNSLVRGDLPKRGNRADSRVGRSPPPPLATSPATNWSSSWRIQNPLSPLLLFLILLPLGRLEVVAYHFAACKRSNKSKLVSRPQNACWEKRLTMCRRTTICWR